MRLIDGDALIEELNNNHFPGAPYVDAGISIAIGKVLDAPTIEPELHYDEWCTDCREYDQEHHSCPRWNRVIRQTVEEYKAAQPEMDCMLKEYGDCTYSETGCSDCAIKAKVKKALEAAQPEPYREGEELNV